MTWRLPTEIPVQSPSVRGAKIARVSAHVRYVLREVLSGEVNEVTTERLVTLAEAPLGRRRTGLAVEVLRSGPLFE